jgi:hypothetical protein
MAMGRLLICGDSDYLAGCETSPDENKIVHRLRGGRTGNRGWILSTDIVFYFLHCVLFDSGVPVSYPIGARGLLPGIKRPVHGAVC